MIKEGVAFAYAESEGLVISWSVLWINDIWTVMSLLGRGLSLCSFVPFFFFLFSDACFFVGCWCVPLAAWWASILVILFSDINSHRSTFVLGGSVDGSKPGPLGITPDQMTDEYIFCNGPFPLLFPLNSQRPAFSSTSITKFYPFKR